MNEQIETTKIFLEGAYQGAYTHIPWKEVRNISDSLFPEAAINTIADSAKGMHHRWKEGHDLIMDVTLDTIPNHGLNVAYEQAKHIILTDFPTKAGIPIPAFSQSGLGQYLFELGIPRGFMSVNLLDTGIGILALADSSINIIQAISGNLEWGTLTAFNTFGVGLFEISVGISTENPLLILSGATNIVAGTKSFYDYSTTPYIFGIPIDTLLMSFGSGFVVGGLIAFLINNNLPLTVRLRQSLIDASKSGTLSTLMAINTPLGFAYIGVFTIFQIGKLLNDKEKAYNQIRLKFNSDVYIDLLSEYMLSDGNLKFHCSLHPEHIKKELITNNKLLNVDLKCSIIN